VSIKIEIKDALKDVKKPDGSSYNIYDDGLKIYTTLTHACRNMPRKQ